jgi:tRNA-splicing ligase RtcB
VIIPLTMADGCIIGTGKGVEDWNFSAPHGAGRIMSRSKAKQTVDLDRYQKVMREAHVWSSCIGKDTLDEAPMVYKRSKVIVDAIQATVDVQSVMKPIYNFKAGGE